MKKVFVLIFFLSAVFVFPTVSMAGVAVPVECYWAGPGYGPYSYYPPPPAYGYYGEPAPVRVYPYYGEDDDDGCYRPYYRDHDCRHDWRHHDDWDDGD